MKKALFSSFLMLLFGLVMFGGTTYAWFTQDQVVSGNSIIMGELEMDVEYRDPAFPEDWYHFEGGNQLFDINGPVSDVQPGATFNRTLRITNTGNIDLAFRVNYQVISDDQGLRGDLNFRLALHDQLQTAPFFNRPLYTSQTSDFIVLEPGEHIIFDVQLHIAEGVGNEAELAQFLFDFAIQGRQVAHAEQLADGNETILYDWDQAAWSLTAR